MGEQYLEHHGILGQKWGVRRYQNPDGTLTPEGRKRYAKRLKSAGKASIAELAAFGRKEEKRIFDATLRNKKSPSISVVTYSKADAQKRYQNVAEALASRPDTREKLDQLVEKTERHNKAYSKYANDRTNEKALAEALAARKDELDAVEDYVNSVINEPLDADTRATYYTLADEAYHPFGGVGMAFKLFSSKQDPDIYRSAKNAIYGAIREIGAESISDLMGDFEEERHE